MNQISPAGTLPALPTPPTPVLAGKRIFLARARRNDPFAAALTARGAEVTTAALTTTIAGAPRARTQAQALLEGDQVDWLVITSARALDFLLLDRLNSQIQIAVVGASTAQAVHTVAGRLPQVIGSGSARSLLAALAAAGVGAGSRLLLAQSALAKPDFADALRAAGARVEQIPIYTTVTVNPAQLPAKLAPAWRQGSFAAAILTSGSNARALVQLLGPPPPRTAIVTIGKPTCHAALAAGMSVDAVASTPDAPGILAAVIEALDAKTRAR